MEVSLSSSVSRNDFEGTALKGLLEAFGSAFSFEQITSAYCRAGRNADLAGEILYCTQGSIIGSSAKTYKDTSRGESAEPANPSVNKNNYGKPKPVKQKWRPISGGTICSVLGKDYTNPTPAPTGSSMVTKPLKLDEEVLAMSELWPSQCDDASGLSISKNEHLHRDVEDFVYRLLGSGFNLDKDVIHQVLEQCGFDVKKGLDNLLDRSTNANKKEDVLGKSSTKECPSAKPLLNDTSPCPDSPYAYAAAQPTSLGRDPKACNAKSPGREEDRGILQMEVLTSLFSRNEEKEESPQSTAKVRRTKLRTRSIALGKLVASPETDFDFEEPKSTSISKPRDTHPDREEEDDCYERLLNAAKEYRSTMKEYYKAAVDAYIMGDSERADKLRDKGEFFCIKAREADEESTRKIFEIKNDADLDDEMLIDLHTLEAKEAISLLKCHLSSLSGIPTINRLKVIIETSEAEDITKGARRRMVVKLLERKSFTWSEGKSEGSILVHLDSVSGKGSASANQ